MSDTERARLALENAELMLNRAEPNVEGALRQVRLALQLLGGIFR